MHGQFQFQPLSPGESLGKGGQNAARQAGLSQGTERETALEPRGDSGSRDGAGETRQGWAWGQERPRRDREIPAGTRNVPGWSREKCEKEEIAEGSCYGWTSAPRPPSLCSSLLRPEEGREVRDEGVKLILEKVMGNGKAF